MTKSLVDWLKEIGQENNESVIQPDGTIQVISNDEQLARMIWQRALGTVETVKKEDGSLTQRITLPDARAQQFIIERREGKYVESSGDKDSLKPLEKITEAIQNQLNAMTKGVLDDSND